MTRSRRSGSPRAVAVLAAGLGTRMKSQLPKVLHELYGQPLLAYALRTALGLKPDRLLAVVGYREDLVRLAFRRWPVEWVSQPQQLGTGHAAVVAVEALAHFDGDVAVTVGDAVLLRPGTLERAFAEHEKAGAAATVITGELADPTGFGRILRDGEGRVTAIVEERDASPEEKAVREVNSGCYVFRYQELTEALRQITPENDQKEYYLTDVVALLVKQGKKVLSVAVEHPHEMLGINSRADLALAHEFLREETLHRLMMNGVTVVDPSTTHVDPRARVAADSVIEPYCILEGALEIERGCHVGPYSHLVGRKRLDAPGREPADLPKLAAGGRASRGTVFLDQAEDVTTDQPRTS